MWGAFGTNFLFNLTEPLFPSLKNGNNHQRLHVTLQGQQSIWIVVDSGCYFLLCLSLDRKDAPKLGKELRMASVVSSLSEGEELVTRDWSHDGKPLSGEAKMGHSSERYRLSAQPMPHQ